MAPRRVPDPWKAEQTLRVDVSAGDDPAVRVPADTFVDVVYQHFVDGAHWDRAVVSPGGTCHLKVQAVLAGAGCPVTAELKDDRGSFATRQARLWNGRKTFTVPVPPDAEGHVRATVTLDGAPPVMAHGVVRLTDPVYLRAVTIAPEQAESVPSNEAVPSDELPAVRDGDLLRLRATVGDAGIGHPATLRVQRLLPPRDVPATQAVVGAVAEDGAVEALWRMESRLDRTRVASQRTIDAQGTGGRYAAPTYRLAADCLGVTATSDDAGEAGRVRLVDDVAVQVVDGATGTPLGEADYTLEWADGTTAEGTLDAEGRCTGTAVPPGPCYLAVTCPTPSDAPADAEPPPDETYAIPDPDAADVVTAALADLDPEADGDAPLVLTADLVTDRNWTVRIPDGGASF